MNIPESYKPLFAKEEIEREIAKIAIEISDWVKKTSISIGKDPIAVPIMRGALFFASDLLRKINASCEIRPLSVKSYEKNRKVKDPIFDEIDWCKKRTILLIDDICETGATLSDLSKDFVARGALEVKSVVLVKRSTGASINPDWACFQYRGSEWLVGYGMDDNERFRNLTAVYKMV